MDKPIYKDCKIHPGNYRELCHECIGNKLYNKAIDDLNDWLPDEGDIKLFIIKWLLEVSQEHWKPSNSLSHIYIAKNKVDDLAKAIARRLK